MQRVDLRSTGTAAAAGRVESEPRDDLVCSRASRLLQPTPHHTIHPRGVGCVSWISLRMSSARQAVVRGPSLTAGGYLPALQPLNQADRLMGMMGATLRRLQPTICHRRRNPDSGIVMGMGALRRHVLVNASTHALVLEGVVEIV